MDDGFNKDHPFIRIDNNTIYFLDEKHECLIELDENEINEAIDTNLPI